MTYMSDQSRVFTPDLQCRGQCFLKPSDKACPYCESAREKKQVADPSELRQVLQKVQDSLTRFETLRRGKTIPKGNIIRKSSRRLVGRPGSSGSGQRKATTTPGTTATTKTSSAATTTQKATTTTKATTDMSNKQQLSLFPRTDNQLPPVTYKVTRAPGDRTRIVLVGKGEQGPDPPVKEVRRGQGVVKGHQHAQSENLQPLNPADGVRRSIMVKHEHTRSDPSSTSHSDSNRDTSADLGELLLPMCYTPTGELIEFPEQSAPERPKEEYLSVDEDDSRPLLSPVPEVTDESMIHRPRPIARPVRRLVKTPELDADWQGLKSQHQHNNASQSVPSRPMLGPRSATQPVVTLLQPNQRPQPPPRSTSAEPPATQSSNQDEDGHVRKDSLEPSPSSFHSEDFVRMVCALRDIDRTCLPLFNQCEILQSQRRQAHREILSLLDQKVLRPSHVSVLRQRQNQLMLMDKKIDGLMIDVMERQRKKMNLVDGLAEIQEIDRKDYMKKMLKENALRSKGLTGRNKELPPPPPPNGARETVGYAQIIDFLEEF